MRELLNSSNSSFLRYGEWYELELLILLGFFYLPYYLPYCLVLYIQIFCSGSLQDFFLTALCTDDYFCCPKSMYQILNSPFLVLSHRAIKRLIMTGV